MPKIAIFMNSLSGGGMERAMLNLANFFVEQGASVDLLVASDKGELKSEVTSSVNLINLKLARNNYESMRWWIMKAAIKLDALLLMLFLSKTIPKAIKVIPALIGYMRDVSPDIILSTPMTANLAVIWAKTYCDHEKKIIIREASTLSSEIEAKKTVFFRLANTFVRNWYNNADVVVCVSDGVNKDLSDNFLVDKSKLKTIYNIIDVENIIKRSKSEEYKSIIHGYGDYILSVGRLEKQKDFEILIRAFHLISDRVSFNLVILGEGSERIKLETLIEKLSLANRVHLPGFFINPYPFIDNCEIFALSSRWEGRPNVLREALIFNKKIISTDCRSGPREILKGGRLGKLVDVGDIESYAELLLELVVESGSSDGLAEMMIEQELAIQKYVALTEIK